MNVELYLKKGRDYHDHGYNTDGCSFVGWLLDDKYEPACWAHDYARAGLIDVKDQGENDNLFRNALRHLGMSEWKSNLMYYFTKTQGFMKDKVNMSSTAFMGFLLFLTMVGLSMYGAGVFG